MTSKCSEKQANANKYFMAIEWFLFAMRFAENRIHSLTDEICYSLAVNDCESSEFFYVSMQFQSSNAHTE